MMSQKVLCFLDYKALSHVMLFKSEQVYIIKRYTVWSAKSYRRLEERGIN